MEDKLYQMVFKRKSFHIFKNTLIISEEELAQIETAFLECKPLIPEIKVGMKIVPAAATTCKRGQEYCILLYSEKKEGYLPNIGYLGQQLDLILASMNIGALWFGIGKTDVPSDEELDFVIMIAIAKMEETKFRKNMWRSKRKPIEEIWFGEYYLEAANIARFAPSACNTQPWIVESNEQELRVFRYKKPGKRGNKANLPEGFTEVVLDGGCHAYFGMYGPQDGDGTPTISNEDQITMTVEHILGWR